MEEQQNEVRTRTMKRKMKKTLSRKNRRNYGDEDVHSTYEVMMIIMMMMITTDEVIMIMMITAVYI